MKILLMCVLMLFPLFPRAADVKVFKGDFEVALSGQLDAAETGGSLRFGSFISDYLQVGVDMDYLGNDLYSQFALGMFVSRLFETSTYLFPYVGGGMELGVYDPKSVSAGAAGGDSGLGVTLMLGMKYFLANHLSLNTEVKFSYSSADAYLKDNAASDTAYRLQVGISYYW